jgi:hypothetical protein
VALRHCADCERAVRGHAGSGGPGPAPGDGPRAADDRRRAALLLRHRDHGTHAPLSQEAISFRGLNPHEREITRQHTGAAPITAIVCPCQRSCQLGQRTARRSPGWALVLSPEDLSALGPALPQHVCGPLGNSSSSDGFSHPFIPIAPAGTERNSPSSSGVVPSRQMLSTDLGSGYASCSTMTAESRSRPSTTPSSAGCRRQLVSLANSPRTQWTGTCRKTARSTPPTAPETTCASGTVTPKISLTGSERL